jgi:hypothetical protein
MFAYCDHGDIGILTPRAAASAISLADLPLISRVI